jgi:hypothetical protein
VIGAGLACLLLASAAPATATTTGGGPSVSGSAFGGLSPGSTLTLRIDAAEAGGWQGLHRLDASLVVGGRAIETVDYDLENQQVSIGDQQVFAGTGGEVAGTYLRVSGADVVVTTGGANISLATPVAVLTAIPSAARVRFQATDDSGRSATASASIGSGRAGGGVSWGTVVATVAVALLAGAFVGNLFASRRRPPPRLSVYSSIQRRIDDERRTEKPAS